MTTASTSADFFPALAAGLCQDSGIGLRVGEHWSFDPRRRVIEVARRHLEQQPDLALGLLAHEVSHVWISRYHCFAPRGLSRPIWAFFLNALEDPRVNGWIRRRYPGTEPWFQTMHAFDRKAPARTPSRFLAWSTAVSVADAYGWKRTVPWIWDRPRVRRAFECTADARHRYALELPPSDLIARITQRALHTAFAGEVAPHLNPGAVPRGIDEAETLVLLSAARAIGIAVVEVLPAVRALIKDDERAIASFLAGNPSIAEALGEGLKRRQDEVQDIVEHALRAPPERYSDADAKLARRAFADYVARIGARSRLDGAGAEERGARDSTFDEAKPVRRRRNRAARPIDPEKVDRAVRQQLPSLVRDMEAILEPCSRRRYRPGYATGQRLDLRRAMAFEADRRGYDRLWRRRDRPDRPMAAISLLVDLSGSMAGDKIEAATIGTMLLAETLERLAPTVRYAITGFQDELIPFIAFGETLSPLKRRAILEMQLEAHGERPNGLNRPRYNDDGPCLAEAAEHLIREPGQRILFVVSDGQPAGRRSNDADLRAVTSRLSDPRANLTLFGLGLGNGTDHVATFYPNAVANIPVDQFAARIGALLMSVIGRSLRGPGHDR